MNKSLIFFIVSLLLFSCSTSPTTTPTATRTQAPNETIEAVSPTTHPPTATPKELPKEEIYPHLAGKGIILKPNDFEDVSYQEIGFLSITINQYTKAPGTPLKTIKREYLKYLTRQIANSAYSDILNRNYKDKYNFDYYSDNYLESYGNLNDISGKNEAIQCLGWYAIVSDLILVDKTAGIHHYPILYPHEIIYEMDRGDIYIFKPKSHSEIRKYDAFIYYNNHQDHIGIILNKYTLDGSVYFLVTEANSPKGAIEKNKPLGNPYIYLVDEKKFLEAIGLSDIYIARSITNQVKKIETEIPSSNILALISKVNSQE